MTIAVDGRVEAGDVGLAGEAEISALEQAGTGGGLSEFMILAACVIAGTYGFHQQGFGGSGAVPGLPATDHDVPAVAYPIEQAQSVVRRGEDVVAERFVGP